MRVIKKILKIAHLKAMNETQSKYYTINKSSNIYKYWITIELALIQFSDK